MARRRARGVEFYTSSSRRIGIAIAADPVASAITVADAALLRHGDRVFEIGVDLCFDVTIPAWTNGYTPRKFAGFLYAWYPKTIVT